MSKRTSLSKRLRFQIFQRDGFKCKYCGKTSLDENIVLEVDHVVPVSAGGSNQPENLVTACFDCNSGKSNLRLSPEEEVRRTLEEVQRLNERAGQIKEMVKWQKAVIQAKNSEVEEFADFWKSLIGGFELTDTGLGFVRQWIKNFGIEAVLESASTSVEKYATEVNRDSAQKAFSMIPRIAAVDRAEASRPGSRKVAYAKGIIRKRFTVSNYYLSRIDSAIWNAVNAGADLDSILKLSKETRSPSSFERALLEFKSCQSDS